MLYSNKRGRPTLPDRYQQFLKLAEMNEFIELLEDAYQETKSEKVHRVLQGLRKAKNKFYTEEEFYRDDEMREFWENPGVYPFSVITFMNDVKLH